MQWNVRMVELNDEAKALPWVPISAPSPERAAIAYAGSDHVWDRHGWSDTDTALVEVEKFGGEHGVHRIKVNAYTSLSFSAETEEA